MEENAQAMETLSAIIRARRSIRSFTNTVPPAGAMNEIMQSAIFAPFGRATELPPKDNAEPEIDLSSNQRSQFFLDPSFF